MSKKRDPELAARVATRLRAVREAAGLTQEQASERAGLMPETISRAESGNRVPTLITLHSLALAYRLELHELLNFGDGLPRFPLSPVEAGILELWRRLPEPRRQGLLLLLEPESSSADK